MGGYVENALPVSTVAYNLTGNDLDNVLAEGDGNDTLDGGAGADSLEGGVGNDVELQDGHQIISQNTW